METPTKTKFITVFAVGNVLDPHIAIQGKCRACGGNGQGRHVVRCGECRREFYPDDPESGDRARMEAAFKTDCTPCGHSWATWYEHSRCEGCNGTGEATDLVRLSELLRTVGPALEFIGMEEED